MRYRPTDWLDYVSWFMVFCLLVILAFITTCEAGATERTTNQSNQINNQSSTNSMTAGNSTVGDTVVGYDSSAYAFAHALGDVDINDCLASTQWGTIIVSAQKVILNKWCAAEVYDAKGLYAMAGKLRCDIPEVAKFFDNAESCWIANTMPALEPVPEITESPRWREHEQIEEEHQRAYQQIQETVEGLQVELDRMKKPVARPVIAQPFLNDDKRRALAELSDGT